MTKPDPSVLYYYLPNRLVPAIREMRDEFLENRLEVVKVFPVDDEKPPMRMVLSKNPKWYSELCKQYPKGNLWKKKPQTFLSRRRVFDALTALLKKRKSRARLAEYLINVARERYEENELRKKDELDQFEKWDNQF